LQKIGIHADSKVVFEAIATVAEETRFHPVRDYLDGIEWDGTSRLDDWLITYMKVRPDPDRMAYVKAVGSRWMIGAVARVYEPG
jgi:putative DNA primase/helicase